ncbi:MAG: hypothetical protein BWY22_00529 [Bacteroidetes bacterium ADurb.Bin217]|nr:MAG: hypothetical protein BWY22_00529 [Bacteroidetes bacterium ADurb.Bin217]
MYIFFYFCTHKTINIISTVIFHKKKKHIFLCPISLSYIFVHKILKT